MISDDPQIAIVLSNLGERLRARGYDKLAFKIENLLELHKQELEEELKRQKKN